MFSANHLSLFELFHSIVTPFPYIFIHEHKTTNSSYACDSRSHQDHIQRHTHTYKRIVTRSLTADTDNWFDSGVSRLAPAPSHDLTLYPSSLSPCALTRPYNGQRMTQECVSFCSVEVCAPWLRLDEMTVQLLRPGTHGHRFTVGPPSPSQLVFFSFLSHPCLYSLPPCLHGL